MVITIILGTRPEIIKMSPIIRLCTSLNIDFFILHSGQHYSYNMDRIFFEQLELPSSKYNLNIGSGSHGLQTGRILMGIEKILLSERPEIVLVEGDTNTVLAGALAAAKLGIKVGHVEAGLRSYDNEMPEEINRVLVDHCSDFLFAPTENSKQILLGEGLESDKIHVTGNTIVDAVYQNVKVTDSKDILDEYNIQKNKYFLVTIHRQENTENEKRLRNILKGLEKTKETFNLPIICTIHPRTENRLRQLGIDPAGIDLVPSIDYVKFLQLEKNASLVLTDSGGVQEETCILGTPCVTLRNNTERPETLDVGSNILAGTDPDNIVKCARQMLGQTKTWNQPFGDGKAADRIMKIIVDDLRLS